MSFLQTAALLGSFAASASAHGLVSGIVAGGKYYQGYDPSFQYSSPAPDVVGWSIPDDTDRGFVAPSAYSDPDIICHKGATPGALSASVAAGDTVELQWTAPWPESHHGPVIDYLADCGSDCAKAEKESLKFFKIDAGGLNDGSSPPGNWASDDLIANNNSWTVTIPSDLAAGNYVLRHEIIALHSAGQEDGAQNYPQCVNLKVTGSGSATYDGTLGTALYKSDDPGILVDIYQTMSNYEIPGPALISGAESGSGGSGSGSGSGGSSAAPSSPAESSPAVSSAAPASSGAAGGQSSAGPVSSAAPSSAPAYEAPAGSSSAAPSSSAAAPVGGSSSSAASGDECTPASPAAPVTVTVTVTAEPSSPAETSAAPVDVSSAAGGSPSVYNPPAGPTAAPPSESSAAAVLPSAPAPSAPAPSAPAPSAPAPSAPAPSAPAPSVPVPSGPATSGPAPPGGSASAPYYPVPSSSSAAPMPTGGTGTISIPMPIGTAGPSGPGGYPSPPIPTESAPHQGPPAYGWMKHSGKHARDLKHM